MIANDKEKLLSFCVVTPSKSTEVILCDSVHIPVCDTEDGKFGGSYGIRFGHADTMFAVAEGKACAYLKNEKIYEIGFKRGFATVEKNEITVFTDEITDM